MKAEIYTEKGLMKVEFYEKDAPKTVQNFVDLSKKGFYDGLTFHRVIPDFVIQGGCPDGTGRGGPDWAIECECDQNTHKHQKGTLSMAHAGRDTGGSQFFICLNAQPHLDGMHTVFGDLVEDDKKSFETLKNIAQDDKMLSVKIVESLEDN